jgi:L-threonylcarbamoyladenylate synthase
MGEIIDQCIAHLNQGKLLLYPTDTVWGIGCDAANEEAVKRVYDLKEREDSKALICMVAHPGMLRHYVDQVPAVAFDLIDQAQKPTTLIFDEARNIASNLLAKDGSIGMRVASDIFCQKLVGQFGRPIVSTSANVSGQPTPLSFEEIAPAILKGVDYVVPLPELGKSSKPSSVVRLKPDGSVLVIRE